MGSWIVESPAQYVEALGGWLTLQPASAIFAAKRTMGHLIGQSRRRSAHTPLVQDLGAKKRAPRLSPAGPGLREKPASNHTRCGLPWITPPRRSWHLALRRSYGEARRAASAISSKERRRAECS
jgi:hypothetical protein